MSTFRTSTRTLAPPHGNGASRAWLFDGTIEENIAFGREGATREEVQKAARETSVDRLIRQLPDGYDTRISDDGDTLSVGERQLLTIARAFIAYPEIAMPGEATSSVDTRTEVLVQEAMDTLRQGKTAFVIAHRLSTIRDAELILVMEDGDVVEQGTHDDLCCRRCLRTAVHGPVLRAPPRRVDSGAHVLGTEVCDEADTHCHNAEWGLWSPRSGLAPTR